MTLSEKAAYIKGLAEGLDLEDSKNKEARVLKEVLELLSEMASDIEDIGADLTDLYDAVDEIDEDLGAVEEELYGDDDDDCGCGEDFYEITCPGCGDAIVLDEDRLFSGEDIECPNCHEKIELEIDGCDCGCDEHDHKHEDK